MQKLTLVNAANIKPSPIIWLWKDWIAADKIHLLAGPAGTGKTTIALAIAAILSAGDYWPDGSRANRGKIVIWSGEDSPENTLVPRLIALNADMQQVAFVGHVQNRSSERTFDPALDIQLLSDAINDFGDVGLLILDPIVSCVDADSHKNVEVRRALQPLVNLALERNCAILGITHLNKGNGGQDPLNRVIGSVAFAAIARVVLFATKVRREPSKRILTRIKSNIGPDQNGYFYELPQITLEHGIETTTLEWGEFYNGDISVDIDGANDFSRVDKSEFDDACEFLIELLSNGPIASVEIQNQARQAGFSKSTLRRAKSGLKVKSKREKGFAGDGVWQWYLPDQSAI
jgi:putative DNA primase/helicase